MQTVSTHKRNPNVRAPVLYFTQLNYLTRDEPLESWKGKKKL
jgi:hypothetical protein